MSSVVVKIVKSLLPPLISNFISDNFKTVKWHGDYPNWSEAKKNSIGYESDEIFKNVKNSALMVKSGRALFERDSSLFFEPSYSWPLLCSLLRIAALNNNNLNLIDFGGSLGSTYFQHKNMLSHLSQITWNIVEQPHYASFGNLHIKDNVLNFYDDLDICIRNTNASLFMASCSMQYISTPIELASKIKLLNFKYLLFDRTAFIDKETNLLTVQQCKSGSTLYSYPAWFFNFEHFKNLFFPAYSLLTTFDSYCDPVRNVNGKKAEWRGLLFEKVKN